MKIRTVSIIVSLLVFASACLASETHDIDKGIEKSLRSVATERHVQIHVHEGVVTLDGQVPTPEDRQRLEALVRGTSGVVAVKDNLKVGMASANAPVVAPAPPAPVEVRPPEVRESVRIPVYTEAPPEAAPPSVTVVMPPPVIVPEYPKLKVQAWTADDGQVAHRIARQLKDDQVPTAGFGEVTITVRAGTVSLKGSVDSRGERDDIITSLQRTSGVRAIYDQLRVR
jgi:osmotically-inducible protein OsmY